jgi:hypothetical protein
MGQQRGWGQLRGRGPGALAVLAVMLLAAIGLLGVVAGYRLPVVASRPSRVILALLGGVVLAGATQRLLPAGRRVANVGRGARPGRPGPGAGLRSS